MPGLDGLEVVQRLRKRGQTLPVLLLTARARGRVKGLNVGADDYLQTFELEELDARLRGCCDAAKGRASRRRELRVKARTLHSPSAQAPAE